MASGWYRAHMMLALAFALAARFWFLWDKPFWRDEAWVGHLVRLPYPELAASYKPVPAGFAMLAKLVSAADFLPLEISLRLPSLLAGMLIVALVPALVRLLGGSRLAAVLGVWLAAGCQPLIYYSRELKHYSLDTLAWLLGAYLLLLILARERHRPRRRALWGGLALTLTVAPWFTFGSLFPLNATLAIALFVTWRKGHNQRLWGLAACTALHLCSFALVLKTSVLTKVHYVTTHPFTLGSKEYFQYEKVPGLDQVALALAWFFKIPISYAFPFAGLWLTPLLLLGLWSWPRPFRAVLSWFIALTALLTISAALINHYVLMQRTLLFLIPVYLVLAAQGGAWLWGRAQGKPALSYPARSVAVVLVMLSLTWGGLSMMARMGMYKNSRQSHFFYDEKDCVEPALSFVAQTASPNEPVLFTRYAGTQFLFYSKGRLPRANLWYHTDLFDEPAEFAKWLNSVGPRGWLVFLDNDHLPWQAGAIREQGFTWRKVFAGRGSNVWLLERGNRGNAGAGQS